MSARPEGLERADCPTFVVAKRYCPRSSTLFLGASHPPLCIKARNVTFATVQRPLASSAVRAIRTKAGLSAAKGAGIAPILFAGVWVIRAGDCGVSRGISSHLLGLCRSGAAGGVMFDGVVTSGTGLSATLLNAGEALAPPPREDRVLFEELIWRKIPKKCPKKEGGGKSGWSEGHRLSDPD